MRTAAAGKFKLGLALSAFGIELKLWKEPGEREWGAILRDGQDIVNCRFEEDNLTLAKLHVLGEARVRAVNRSGSPPKLPGCDTLLGAWKPVKMEGRA